MKKVKVIFPDGSTAELDESQVSGAIAAGAKRFVDDSVAAKTKSTSMVFPDGSIADVPSDAVDGAIKVGAVKKNIGSNGSTVDVSITAPKPAAITSQSESQKSTNISSPFDLSIKTPSVVTNDGIEFPVTEPISFVQTANTLQDIQALQQRIRTNTATPADIQVLSRSSGKSVKATEAYITKGRDDGSAFDVNESIEKSNQQAIEGYNALRPLLGALGKQFQADEVVSSADKSSIFLQQINDLQDEDARGKNIAALPTPFVEKQPFVPNLDTNATEQVNNVRSILIDNIKKLTVEEAEKKGLSSQQTGELLYSRLDPVGYAKNQSARNSFFTDAAKKISSSTLGTPLNQLSNLVDWVSNKNQVNYETLNAERGQYELDANDGMKQLAIEKKAQGIANNDQSLIDEAFTIGSKIKDDDSIIEKYPLLIKQRIANYINQRFAQEAGILEGTEAVDGNGRLLKVTGINRDITRRYAMEGGFYDNPNYSNYVEEVVSNPETYLADNSYLGRAGISFLKPFKSIFNTVEDLAGVRTSTDRHLESVREEIFPSQLTEGVKKDISFEVAGHDFSMNVANTVNSIANLGGYMALATATGGLSSTLGASASTAHRMGAWGSFGMEAIDTGLKEADRMGLKPAEAWMYAGMKGVMMAEGGRLLEFGKGAIPTIKGVNEDLAKAVVGISNKTLSKDAAREALNGVGNVWVKGLKKYGVGTLKGAGVMTGFTVGDNLLRVGFGDENVNLEELLPEAGNAFFNGLFTMAGIGAFGLPANIRNAKNSTYKGMLSKVIDNADASHDILKIGLERGLFTPEEYNQKVKILDTGVKAKNTLFKLIASEGFELTPEQRATWVANTTVEHVLRGEAERKDIKESKAKELTEKADNLLQESTDIIDGLTFNNFLEPNYALYDALKELRQAQADFAKSQTPANEKILLDKKAAYEAIRSGKTIDTELSKPIEGLDEQGVPITAVADNQILTTFENVRKVIPEERLTAAQDIITRVNNAENINENEIRVAEDELYSALETAPEAAHLIEPLILKLQDYEFTTKIETGTVTKEVATEVARPAVERKPVNYSISQWEGNRATITDPATGRTTEGIVRIENGMYSLHNANGEKVASIGEKQLTDRDVSMASAEEVPRPVEVDSNGNVRSVTLQLNMVDLERGGTNPSQLIKIHFTDPEKGLDYAIRLGAERAGEFPQPDFDVAYEQVQTEVQTEVLKSTGTKVTEAPKSENKPTVKSEEGVEDKKLGIKENLKSKGFDVKPNGVYEKNGVRFTIENDKVYEVNNGEPSKYYANKTENAAIIENIENISAEKGIASKLLDEIIQVANEEGKELQLFPRPPKGGKLTKQQLTEWYERKGFVLREDGIMVKKPEQSISTKSENKPTVKSEEVKNVDSEQFGISKNGDINKYTFGVNKYVEQGGLKVTVANRKDIGNSISKLKELNSVLKNKTLSNTIEYLDEALSLYDRAIELMPENDKKRDKLHEESLEDIKKTKTYTEATSAFKSAIDNWYNSAKQGLKEFGFELNSTHSLKQAINKTVDAIQEQYVNLKNVNEHPDRIKELPKSENKPITEQKNKPVKSEEVKQPEISETVKSTTAASTATVPVTEMSFSTRARELADQLDAGEKNVLPSWMRAKLPPGTKLSGIDINKAYANALRAFADIYDATKEFSQAVNEGFKHIRDWFSENKIPIDEAEMKADFESEVGEKVRQQQAGEGGGKKPPVDTGESEFVTGDGEADLNRMASKIPNKGHLDEYASKGTIEKFHAETPENDQTIIVQELRPALEHGENIIERAKDVFGEQNYVENTLNFIERSGASTESKALMYISLENALRREKENNPTSLDIQKKQNLARAKSQAFLRGASLAINFGKLRRIGLVGYDITQVTDNFFSGKQREEKKIVEKSVEADADAINKMAETMETENVELQEKINEAVESEITKIYQKMPTERRKRADEAIAALERFQQKIRGKTYDASIGVPLALIDAGITVIKRSIRAGVAIADAIDLGIQHIKEKYGKPWGKQGEFKADMIAGFKAEGIKKQAKATPNRVIKNALIDAGFGRETTVKTKTGREKRNILDWRKLAGEEGSVDRMKENVTQVLEKQGYTKQEISDIQKDLADQYDEIRAAVIENSITELNKRNKVQITAEQKSAARKLAELYNYGLFEQNPVEFDILLGKAIGMDKISPERFEKVHQLANALETMFSTKFNGKKLNDLELKTALQSVDEKMRILLNEEAQGHGSTRLKIANIARTFMDATQRMILNNLKQAVENPFSGKSQVAISSIDRMMNSNSTPELRKQQRKIAASVYKDMVLSGGVNYGDVGTTFVSRGNLDAYINKLTDNQLAHAILSTAIGKTTLDAADAYYKSKLTDLKFTHNLIKILTERRLVNGKLEEGMSKEEAINYVSEKLTGQSFEAAKKTATEIINKVNSGGEKILGDTDAFVNRLANDIVKAALVNGRVITTEQVTSAYNAAYRSAGRSLGHVANNPLSESIQSVSGKLEKKINDAIKEKDYRKAAHLTLQSIFFRNMLNPFVAGGTNWVVLKFEKNGLGLFSGLYNDSRTKLDLTSEAGLKKAEQALYEEARDRDAFMRGAIGGGTAVLTAMLWGGVLGTDDYRKWRNRNKWASRYLDIITPEGVLAAMAAKNRQLPYYIGTLINKNDSYDAAGKIIKATGNYSKGDTDKALGQLGEATGGKFGVPVPWRLVRDGQNIWLGATGEEPYRVNNEPSEGFWEGAIKAGVIDYIKNNPVFK